MARSDLDPAWSLLSAVGVSRDDRVGPVILGRELLIQAFEVFVSTGNPSRILDLVKGAATTFAAGVRNPRPEEYPLDGVEYGRCDALMWYGISSGLLVMSNDRWWTRNDSRPHILGASSDPGSLEIASFGFESVAEPTKAGRCSEEFGELVKEDVGSDAARFHFLRAADLFDASGDPKRAAAARRGLSPKSPPSSPFFRRLPPTMESTTVTGSSEYRMLRAVTLRRKS